MVWWYFMIKRVFTSNFDSVQIRNQRMKVLTLKKRNKFDLTDRINHKNGG